MTVQFNSKQDIPVREMKDNTIGIITQWDGRSEYIGHIVIVANITNGRYLQSLSQSGINWSTYRNLGDHCRVRVLNEGDTITI